MMNTTFIFCTLLVLATSALASESFGQADVFLNRKSGKDKEFDFAGYDEAGYDSLISMDDDHYHDDQNAEEFSYIRDEPEESSIDLRACAHTCGGKCYNPVTHQCCNGILLNGFWSCSKCVHKCDDRCYPKGKGFKCCYNKVIPDAWQCCPHHCAGKCYTGATQKCCYDQIIPRSKVCCKHYCGDNCYDPTSTSCCNGEVIDKNGRCCSSKCGQACLDTKTQHCCHQRIAPKSVPCISGSGPLLRITTGLNARSVGCFRDTWTRAIPTLEGHSRLLTGSYRSRPYAIEKCALVAAMRGWSVFAVQHQGWCASSPTAGSTYNKYGPYNTCTNGKGGPWGNDVYVLEGNAAQKTTAGDICVFPFIYKGKHYNSCTNVDRNGPWCAITPNYDVDKLWGNC